MDEKGNVGMDTRMNGAETKVDLLDYVAILMRWRRFIIINVLVVTVASVIIASLLPKWYKATASILPPKDQGMFSSLGIAGSVLKGLAPAQRISGLSQKTGTYNYLAILKSRTAMEAVVRKFDLINVYDISDSSMERTLSELGGNVTFEVQDDDNITIEVVDRDAARAASMANFFVDALNSISNQLGTQEARSNREFIEKRLSESREELRKAEDALKNYQEKSGAIVSSDPNSPMISAIAELYGFRAKKEIELAILKKTVSGENSTVKQLELELSELNRKLGTFPKSGLDSYRLFRDAAIQQKIVEYLMPVFEQSKIDEQKDIPVILVLDTAVPAEKKFKPKRTIIVLSAGLSALLLSIVVAFAIERIQQLRNIDPARYEKIADFFRTRSGATER